MRGQQDADGLGDVVDDPAGVGPDPGAGEEIGVDASGRGLVDVVGGAVGVQVRGVNQHRGLGQLQLERDGVGLGGVEGVGDRFLGRLLADDLEHRASHAELRAGQHQRQDRHERGPVQRLIGALGAVVSLDRGRHGDDPVVRDEDVLGDHAVAAGGLHPGDEPGFLVLQVAARDQRQPLVDGLALLVGDRDAEHRPAGMPGAGVVIPAAADPVPAVDLAGLGGRGEHPADQRVGILAPHLVLGLLRVQAGHPGAHVQQRRHPGGAAVGLAERGRHVEHGAHRGLIAPVPLRLGDLEDARLA